MNLLGMVAAEAAYAHGDSWVDEMLIYLRDNHTHFARSVNNATDKVRVLPADSLYPGLDGLPRPGHDSR